jgi:sporulation protein YabP
MLYEEKEKQAARPHNVIMEDRSRLSVSGVIDVESFDDRQIVAKTAKGSLIIRGSELHIDKLSLDLGELVVTGLVTDLGYEETAPGGSLWSRLFK